MTKFSPADIPEAIIIALSDKGKFFMISLQKKLVSDQDYNEEKWLGVQFRVSDRGAGWRSVGNGGRPRFWVQMTSHNNSALNHFLSLQLYNPVKPKFRWGRSILDEKLKQILSKNCTPGILKTRNNNDYWIKGVCARFLKTDFLADIDLHWPIWLF